MMQDLNLSLFTLLNAGEHVNSSVLALAIFLAKYVIYWAPLCLVVYWFWRPQYRGTLLFATIAAVLALLMNAIIGVLWFAPRPFMLGIGHTYLIHAPDSTFPSDHVTFMWAIGLSFLVSAGLRFSGGILLALTVCVGWARVFLGVHFPFDIMGSMLISSVIVLGLIRARPWIECRILPWAEWIYHKLFAKVIAWKLVQF